MATSGYARTYLGPFSPVGLVSGLATGFVVTVLLHRTLPDHLLVQWLEGVTAWVLHSGTVASFSIILVSELGDKTFFMTALLAIQLSKTASFLGSVMALAVMTMISVGIGCALRAVPDSIRSTERLGQWVGAICLAFFGVQTIMVRGQS